MGQKANPISLQVGRKKSWNTSFTEQKKRENGFVIFQEKSLKNVLKKIFEAQLGSQIQSLKLHYHRNSITFSIFMNSNITSSSAKKKKRILLKNKMNKYVVSPELTAPQEPLVLAKICSMVASVFDQTKKVNFLIDYSNNMLGVGVDRTHKVSLKKHVLSLRRFKRQEFFQRGVESVISTSQNLNQLHSLMKFLSDYLKNARKINRCVKFLQKFLKLLIENPKFPLVGVKIKIKGRLNGANRGKTRFLIIGDVPCHSINKSLEFISSHSVTKNGTLGLKIWAAGREKIG